MSKQLTVALIICALAGGVIANPVYVEPPAIELDIALIVTGALTMGVLVLGATGALGTYSGVAAATPERLDFSTESSPGATPLADDTVRREPLVGASVANLSEEMVWAALAEQGWERPGRKPFATRDSEYGNEELVVILTNGEPPAIESVRYTCEGDSWELIEARYQELIVMYEEGSKGPGLHSGTGSVFGCYWEDDDRETSFIEYYPPGEGGPRIELEISY